MYGGRATNECARARIQTHHLALGVIGHGRTAALDRTSLEQPWKEDREAGRRHGYGCNWKLDGPLLPCDEGTRCASQSLLCYWLNEPRK